MTYLYPKQLVYLHREIIKTSGGSSDLRDRGLLESAAARPHASYGGHDFYPDLFHKVAALGHSLIMNHPFVDGNKRVGIAAMRLMLRLNGYDLKVGIQEKFKFVMKISKSKLSETEIASWLKVHSSPYDRK